MSRRGENIYRRKDGRWEGRIIDGHSPDGKALYTYLYGHSYEEVKQKLALKRAQSGNEQVHPRGCLKAFSCADIATAWLSSKRCKVKDSTYARYLNLIDNYIIPYLGAYAVPELSDSLIAGYLEQLLRSGRKDGLGGLAAKTVTDVLAVLKAILRYAERKGCPVPVCMDELMVRKSQREMQVLSLTEQEKLMQTLVADLDRRRLGVMLSLYTGLRLGEVCALRWEHIDLNSRTIHVRETMQRIQNNTGIGGKTIVVVTEPKSECSRRDIPIPDFLFSIINSLYGKQNAFVMSGRADKFVEPRSMENYFRRCIIQSGIAPVNYHALRHSFATRCVELGFDIKSLSEILGHSNVNITLNCYVHSSLELKRQNMNKLKMLSSA